MGQAERKQKALQELPEVRTQVKALKEFMGCRSCTYIKHDDGWDLYTHLVRFLKDTALAPAPEPEDPCDGEEVVIKGKTYILTRKGN